MPKALVRKYRARTNVSKALVRKYRAATHHPCTEVIAQEASMWSQDVAGASVHCAPIVGEYSFGTGADTHSAGKHTHTRPIEVSK